jgi:hypothetical protein
LGGQSGRKLDLASLELACHPFSNEAVIQPLTDIGEVTTRIFDFNNDERMLERQALMEVGRYLSAAARQRMTK